MSKSPEDKTIQYEPVEEGSASETENTPESEIDILQVQLTEAEEKISQAETKLAEAEKQLEDGRGKYLRMAAEYENYRKRSAKERDNIYSDAQAQTILSMLPVLDNLERAASQPTSDEAFLKGLEMTLKQFYDCLAKLGVQEIKALGEQFDPNLHNAVMHVEQDGCDDNTIVEVFQKGFIMGDKVIRHAMVKVAN